jgi:hypothetical protein
MLRAYYSRICDQVIFRPDDFKDLFNRVNNGGIGREELRADGRAIIREMAKNIGARDDLLPRGTPPEAWLVTDFVTLGSPLTHARYLMCNGATFDELGSDFRRRTEEREFPTCPPTQAAGDDDGWLAFKNPRTGQTSLHHGGLFALTRWTNLYFRMSQVFWGDPVGGPVGTEDVRRSRPLFGTHVEDREVWLHRRDKADLFTHTAYWSVEQGTDVHIDALRKAINLEDR